MSIIPLQPSDPFEAANRLTGGSSANSSGQSFNAASGPSQSGFGTRESQVPNFRVATNTRKMMRWLVPEMPIVEMYVNPQSVNYDYKKVITETRTKGGYVLQYWGEDLISLNLSGTTGSSGIEGINVLLDVYRNEQLMFDPYALALQGAADSQSQSDASFDIFGQGLSSTSSIGGITSLLSGKQSPNTSVRNRPTLASMAFTVELYWSGEVYRGYFKGFKVTESATNLGMFEYVIDYRVTQKRGFRQNFLAWHRSPTNGPSNSNPQYGTPYSFGSLAVGTPTPQQNNVDQPSLGQNFVDIGKNIAGNANSVGKAILSAFDI